MKAWLLAILLTLVAIPLLGLMEMAATWIMEDCVGMHGADLDACVNGQAVRGGIALIVWLVVYTLALRRVLRGKR